MSSVAKSKIANLFTLLVVFCTAFQGLIPTMPINDPITLTTLSGVTLCLVTVLTAWKQWLSVEIDNKSLWATLTVALIATLGGINDMVTIIDISGYWGQWIRFGITFATMFINLASKILWPTNDTKSAL